MLWLTRTLFRLLSLRRHERGGGHGFRLVGRVLCNAIVGLSLIAPLVSPAQMHDDEEPQPDLIQLDAHRVAARWTGAGDRTGMGSQEAELKEPPFSNDLLSGHAGMERLLADLNIELQLATGITPAELAAGVNRVNLRGFPAPRLRNGFTQIGVPEAINVERVELIQGPLTPVAGRGAPGGIQNFVTYRPRGDKRSRAEAGFSTNGERRARIESTGPLIPKKLWERWMVGVQEREGPEIHASTRTVFLNGALTYRHSEAASTMVTLDFLELSGNPSPGVPEYRASRNEKIAGPFRPLAYFHAYGPDAGMRKRVASASWQFEGQLGSHLSLRAGVQGLKRSIDEDRFTTSQYLLDTGKFGGTREPQHQEQSVQALAAQADLLARFSTADVEHKVQLSIDSTRSDYVREQRALERADRDALPADVRVFDPSAPNYYRPAYDPLLYRRMLIDRDEAARYSGISLSERAAFWRGRLVVSAGVRADQVALEVVDEKPGVALPRVEDTVSEATYHAGANYQITPGKLLVFANTSTAFEPSTRVDARTGRIQGNETTLGYETGAKALWYDRKVSATLLMFQFDNQNISRRNPLYEDPIADANQTQPQLLEAGQERFRGGTCDVRAQLTKELTISGRATITHAITTKSLDLPEEVGRALTRTPRTTYVLNGRYAPQRAGWVGFSVNASLSYVGSFVANYESPTRSYLTFPGYTLTSVSCGYVWKRRTVSHNVSVSVRNAFDRDMVALLARPGAGRDFGANYSITF